jgi:hypothetical protein|eukprot:1796658-Prymnesium_polylepis.2
MMKHFARAASVADIGLARHLRWSRKKLSTKKVLEKRPSKKSRPNIMSTITYTAPRKGERKYTHAILQVDGDKYMIPKLPQVEIGDDQDWDFTGPLMS